jgi:hypothetical protein
MKEVGEAGPDLTMKEVGEAGPDLNTAPFAAIQRWFSRWPKGFSRWPKA